MIGGDGGSGKGGDVDSERHGGGPFGVAGVGPTAIGRGFDHGHEGEVSSRDDVMMIHSWMVR